VLEIHPVQPEGRLYPADNAVLEKWLLSADTSAGTLEFTEDRAFIITPARTVTSRCGRPGGRRRLLLLSKRSPPGAPGPPPADGTHATRATLTLADPPACILSREFKRVTVGGK
jgi:hypothetical protein